MPLFSPLTGMEVTWGAEGAYMVFQRSAKNLLTPCQKKKKQKSKTEF